MTANHPYPKHVIEAVAVAILNYYEYLDGRNTSAVEIANVALTGLWEASRVETPDQLDKLADQAIIHDGYFHYEKDVYSWLGGTGYEYIPSYEMSLPSHVIYWGDSDE